MFSQQEGVRVHQVKDQTGPRQQGALLQELISQSDRGRLRLVLNCAGIRHLDGSTIMFLLSCLEVAMMCKGDVRLAAVSPLLEAKLRQIGIAQLFELHATAEAAVQSFERRLYSVVGMTDQTRVQLIAAAA